MPYTRESEFKIFSLGIVVEDKDKDGDIIKVTPIEHLSFSEGLLSAISEEHLVAIVDAFKKSINVKKESGVVIEAEWRSLSDTNRMTAPNVVANETVLIWRFANTDIYYWNTIGREPLLRRLEKVVYLYGGIKEKFIPLDATNSYWLMIDTFDKVVHFHTSNANGEPFTYDVIFNTNEGSVSIFDSINNSIVLNSVDSTLTANINKKIIFNTEEIIFNASNSFTVNTETSTINASSSHNEQTPTSNISGNLNVGGNTTVGGKVSAGGVVSGSCFAGPLC